MKNLRSQSDIEMALQLFKINAERRELEKREKAIKDHFKALLGPEGAAKAGDYLVTTTERTRVDLDKQALAAKIDLKQFEVEKSYSVLEIKKLA
jgi:hypothetical protein